MRFIIILLLALVIFQANVSAHCQTEEDGIIHCSQTAQQMKLIGYEEAPDCNYPSTRVCHNDEHGQPSCTIVLNEKCK